MLSMVGGGWRTKIFLALKIIPAIPLSRLDRAYSHYGAVFLIRVCTKMATDLLENFQVKIYIVKANFLNTISLYMKGITRNCANNNKLISN